jgi:hypothetical protein
MEIYCLNFLRNSIMQKTFSAFEIRKTHGYNLRSMFGNELDTLLKNDDDEIIVTIEKRNQGPVAHKAVVVQSEPADTREADMTKFIGQLIPKDRR